MNFPQSRLILLLHGGSFDVTIGIFLQLSTFWQNDPKKREEIVEKWKYSPEHACHLQGNERKKESDLEIKKGRVTHSLTFKTWVLNGRYGRSSLTSDLALAVWY